MGRETKETEKNRKTRHKMGVVGPHVSIITLNVNGLNSPIKRHRVAGWIKEQDPTICCLQETHLSPKDKHRLRVKGWRTILQANNEQKKAGVAILISDKVDFKAKQIKKRSEEHTSELQSRQYLVCRLLLEKKHTPQPSLRYTPSHLSLSNYRPQISVHPHTHLVHRSAHRHTLYGTLHVHHTPHYLLITLKP